MSKLAEINARKYFLIEKDLYPSIRDEFADIEEGKSIDTIQKDRLFDKIKKALGILKQIDTASISTVVDDKAIESIEDNIGFMYEEILNIQKRLMADEYVDNLKVPVLRYFKQMREDPSNYKKWAESEEELAKKFIGMLTNPDNLETYKNQIKRMALGTMSLKEFKKIFDSTKHKLFLRPEYNFKSFKNYKDETHES